MRHHASKFAFNLILTLKYQKMKKKIYLFAILCMALSFIACSSNEEEEAKEQFTLSSSEITVNYDESVSLKVTGADVYECEFDYDDFHIWAHRDEKNEIVIDGEKVGTTTLKVIYGDEVRECKVNVVSTSVDYIGNPVLEFGKSKEEIKSLVTANGYIITSDGEYGFEAKEYGSVSEIPFTHNYYFQNNKLYYVNVDLPVSTDMMCYTNCLNERYKYYKAEGGRSWYKYPNKFFVRLIYHTNYKYKLYNIQYAQSESVITEKSY